MTRARVVLLVVLLAVLALLGWAVLARRGSSVGAGSPEAAVESFYHALGAKDTATACAMTAYAGHPLAGDDVTLCRSGFDAVVDQVASAEDLAALRALTVTGATVTGETATVTADQLSGAPAAYREDVALVRVDGHWFVETQG